MECRKAIFASSKKNEIIFVDNQCKNNCSKTQKREKEQIIKDTVNRVRDAAAAGAAAGAIVGSSGGLGGAVAGAAFGAGGAALATGFAIAVSGSSIKEKDDKINSDHKMCLTRCE